MPATIATMVPASNACRIKSYCHITAKSFKRFQLKARLFMVQMTFFRADYREAPARIAEYLDRRVVKFRKCFRGQHLCGFSCRNMAVGNIDYAVEDRQKWVDVVRDQKHSHSS